MRQTFTRVRHSSVIIRIITEFKNDTQMDIFIDTSVIYTDPFWKRNFPGQLLEAAKDERVRVYIADIVLRELKQNFINQLDKEFLSINSANNNIKKITCRHQDIPTPNIKKYIEDFDKYYEELFKNKNVIMLSTDASMFYDILDRAIEGKKPFTANRSEFKDAVIWSVYFKYAKENKLLKCYFHSNNKKDFTDSDGNLHPELKKDYNKFNLYLTIDEFYKSNKHIIDKPLIHFKKWLENQIIDNDYVFQLLYENENQKVVEAIKRKFELTDPSHLFDYRKFVNIFGGHVVIDEVTWNDCENIEVDIVKDYAIISGVLLLEVSLDLYNYNSARDPGEEAFPYYGSTNCDVKLYFNFLFNTDERPLNFEVTEIHYKNLE